MCIIAILSRSCVCVRHVRPTAVLGPEPRLHLQACNTKYTNTTPKQRGRAVGLVACAVQLQDAELFGRLGPDFASLNVEASADCVTATPAPRARVRGENNSYKKKNTVQTRTDDIDRNKTQLTRQTELQLVRVPRLRSTADRTCHQFARQLAIYTIVYTCTEIKH